MRSRERDSRRVGMLLPSVTEVNILEGKPRKEEGREGEQGGEGSVSGFLEGRRTLERLLGFEL